MRPPLAATSSLIARLGAWFTPPSRDRGAEHVRAKRVTLQATSREHAVAWVRGERLYETYKAEVRVEGATIGARCTCPSFDDEGRCCEHLWALVLAADAASALAVPNGALTLSELPEPEEDEEAQPARRSRKKSGPPPPPPAPPAAASWRALAASSAPASHAKALAPLRNTHARESRCVVKLGQSRGAGAIVVAFEQRTITPRGHAREWRAVSANEAANHAAPEDAEGFELLLQCRTVSRTYGDAASVAVPLSLATGVLGLVARSGRAVVEHESGTRVPLVVDTGPRWRVILVAEEQSGDLLVHAVFVRGAERIDARRSSIVWTHDVGVLVDRVIAIEPIEGFAWLAAVTRGGPVRVPAAERDEFLAFAATRADFELPGAIRFVESGEAARFVARLGKPEVDAARVRARAFATYADREVPLGAPGRAIVDAVARRVHVRDLAAERGAIALVASLGARASEEGKDGEVDLPIARLAGATRALLEAGWRVEGEGLRYRRATRTRASIHSGADWFDLRATIDFDGEEVPLPRLLAAARRGDAFVELGDGSLGVLPEDWLHRWGAIAELGASRPDESVRFARTQATLLDALVDTVPDRALDESFATLRARIASGFRATTEPTIPADVTCTLRDYQRAGVAWMELLAESGFGGCLADDMGLGKTVQVLARLASRRGQGPSLVVAPRSLVFNWKAEAARFVPSMKVLDHTGTGRRATAERFASYDLVVTTYGTLRKDAEALAAIDFDYVVLDEAQAVKNDASESAKAARSLRARHRLALSGTPIENHLGELWSLFEFLNPRMLGRASAFKRWSTTRALDEADRALLARAVRPFLLRRTKKEVARELPERVEQTVLCELEKEQRGIYDELRRHYRRSLLSQMKKAHPANAMNVLEALLRLRQVACHPGLVNHARREAPSAKLDVLFEQLASVLEEGEKAIVFSQFTSLLWRVAERLRAMKVGYAELDGSTRRRDRVVEEFQTNDDCKVFLVSLKAGGAGLNLTAASYVFLLDPWWNPAAEAQAIDRAHRIGQTKTVFAYRLVAKDTIEEHVLALQQSKRELAEEILGGSIWSALRDLRVEDLDLLLS